MTESTATMSIAERLRSLEASSGQAVQVNTARRDPRQPSAHATTHVPTISRSDAKSADTVKATLQQRRSDTTKSLLKERRSSLARASGVEQLFSARPASPATTMDAMDPMQKEQEPVAVLTHGESLPSLADRAGITLYRRINTADLASIDKEIEAIEADNAAMAAKLQLEQRESFRTAAPAGPFWVTPKMQQPVPVLTNGDSLASVGGAAGPLHRIHTSDLAELEAEIEGLEEYNAGMEAKLRLETRASFQAAAPAEPSWLAAKRQTYQARLARARRATTAASTADGSPAMTPDVELNAQAMAHAADTVSPAMAEGVAEVVAVVLEKLRVCLAPPKTRVLLR